MFTKNFDQYNQALMVYAQVCFLDIIAGLIPNTLSAICGELMGNSKDGKLGRWGNRSRNQCFRLEFYYEFENDQQPQYRENSFASRIHLDYNTGDKCSSYGNFLYEATVILKNY
ncbi:hypothetical protein Glove_202g75 [Diversispora epigaea]|uniref:Uncharacterized protein n=1 Tax=Diversispora epigaea TaxID=1348612 RepID=A0A397ISS9_9GLOM|nr:hypothetical protein Glove_202g75 [Diversispora epigaea]